MTEVTISYTEQNIKQYNIKAEGYTTTRLHLEQIGVIGFNKDDFREILETTAFDMSLGGTFNLVTSPWRIDQSSVLFSTRLGRFTDSPNVIELSYEDEYDWNGNFINGQKWIRVRIYQGVKLFTDRFESLDRIRNFPNDWN